MTLETEISRVVYTALAAQTAFPFGYKFLNDADLLVYVDDELQTITTDYTVSGAGLDEGGTVTFTAGRIAGEIIAIVRAPAITQAVDYVENDPFPAETHEGALDKLTMICQALDDGLSRAVKLSVGSSLSNITLPEPDATATLVWNAEETALENGPSTSEISNAQTYANNAAASAATATTQAGLANTARIAAELAETNAEAAAASIPTFGAFGLTLAATAAASNARAALELGTAALVDTGTGAGDVPVLDAGGKLSAGVLPVATSIDAIARDLASFHAFISQIAASRATGPVPKGGMWTFLTDEMTKTNAYYDSSAKAYRNYDIGTPSWAVNSSGSIGYCMIDRSIQVPNSKTIKRLEVYSTIAATVVVYLVLRNFAGNYTVALKTSFSHTGSGWEGVDVNYTVPASGEYYMGSYSAASMSTTTSGVSIAYDTADITGTVTLTEATSGTNGPRLMRYTAGAVNMTLSSPAGVSLGFVPTRATLYLLHKAVDALTYNTDIVVKAARGGSYAVASDLAKLCAYDATYDLLKASIDLSALASGSTGLWGLDTYNTKAQQVRAALALFE